MTGAKSAILFAIPMDRELIRSYLAKDNINARSDHEKDNYRSLINSFAESFRFDPGVLVDGEDGGIDSKEFVEDPKMAGYFKENQIVLSQVSNSKLTCGNCQLVCKGNNLNETKENLKLLKESGMVIRKENGKTQILKGEEIIDAEKLHHPVKMNDQEKKTYEIIKKAFTQDKQYNFNFFPSP